MTDKPRLLLLYALLVALALPRSAAGHPPGMFGVSPSRNMVSDATGLPATWDVDSGANVKWVVTLGSQTYGGPVVAGGRVYVGTNNRNPRIPSEEGDRGVLMVLAAEDGSLLWQAAHQKLDEGRDWPGAGLCSGPYVEEDRLYYVSNRAELVAADPAGFRDGENDGPMRGETRTSEVDQDVVWTLDMIGELGVVPHNMSAGSPVVVGDLVFTVTANGVDEEHGRLPAPDAPSFLAVDKRTGKVVWKDASPGQGILHGTWSNPSFGQAGGRPQIVFPGGDGWLYAFGPKDGKPLWRFDCNPKDAVWEHGGMGTRNNILAMPVSHGNRVYVGTGQDPDHGDGPGHLWAIDATLTGDVTGKAVVWHRGGEDFHRTLSTVAIHDGLLYAADLSGFLYCLDADSGKHHWTYDAFAAVWGSPLVADGKVYLADEDGDVAVLRAGTVMKVLGEPNVGSPVYTTPVAVDGVLYVASTSRLFALEKSANPQPSSP